MVELLADGPRNHAGTFFTVAGWAPELPGYGFRLSGRRSVFFLECMDGVPSFRRVTYVSAVGANGVANVSWVCLAPLEIFPLII